MLIFGFCTTEVYAKNKKYIGVLPLINKSKKQVSPEEIEYLTSIIRTMTSFLSKEEYIVITNDNIDVLLEGKNKELEECVGECALETARNLGADYLITGTVLKFGKSLRVSLNLITSKTGNVSTVPDLLKGKSVEDLEKPLQLASLSLIMEISSDFKTELTLKAGSNREDQLRCLLKSSQCKTKELIQNTKASTPMNWTLITGVTSGLLAVGSIYVGAVMIPSKVEEQEEALGARDATRVWALDDELSTLNVAVIGLGVGAGILGAFSLYNALSSSPKSQVKGKAEQVSTRWFISPTSVGFVGSW